MQSYLQYRRIRKQLEKQHVVKRDMPDDVRTREDRFSFHDGQIQREHPVPDDDEPARRRREEHGHRTLISGPALHPRHTARQHLEHDGDIELADLRPEIEGEPHTINTRDTLGDTPDMMVTGVETRTANTRTGVSHDAGGDSEQKDKRVIVTYEGDCDPMDPHNWSLLSRIRSTLILSLITAIILWSSTNDAAALTTTLKVYSVSFTLEALVIGIFLIGLGSGGLIMAPFSEVAGRNPVYIPSLIMFMAFTAGAAVSETLKTRVVCRFFAGFFGSAPVVCAAGSLVDVWTRTERVYAFPIYSTIFFLGTLVAPTPASFIIEAFPLGWRWLDYMTIMLAGFVLGLVVLFQPETYSPVLLHWKAKQLRRLTGDPRYRAPLEFKRVSFLPRVVHSMYRPFVLFATEPIIMGFAVYLSAIWIMLFTFIAGNLYIYAMTYKFDEDRTAMSLLGLAVGTVLNLPFTPLAMKLVRRDIHRARTQGQCGPGPEISLYMAMFGAPAIPISLFWMGWTARPSISVWSPLSASVLFGWGVLCVFVSSSQYVADAFEDHAASAIACINLFRSVAAGIMVEIGQPFYHNLGVAWSLTVLGAIATVFLPVPYVLYYYGPVVRSWSRYSVTA